MCVSVFLSRGWHDQTYSLISPNQRRAGSGPIQRAHRGELEGCVPPPPKGLGTAVFCGAAPHLVQIGASSPAAVYSV